MIQNDVTLNTTTFKKGHEKQVTFRSASGKDKQLDLVLIDKRSRRYCTGAVANDMIHLVSDHRLVTAHFRFPCVNKERTTEQRRSERTSSQTHNMQEAICINGNTRRSRVDRQNS